MEIVILVLLVVLNGVFAMSELAVVSSRKARLQHMNGAGAKIALELANHPNRFLATVQVGITLVGIVTGAFGGATLSRDVAVQLNKIDALEKYSDPLAFVLVVGLTTYLSLVIGELVPKRLALRNPERIAVLVAPPMKFLSTIFAPIVRLLSLSTELILLLFGERGRHDDNVTDAEIIQMIRQGIKAGVFEEEDDDLVEGVFRLTDHRVTEVMIPRTEVMWLEVAGSPDDYKRILVESTYSFYPLCQGGLDQVLGFVRAKDVLKAIISEEPFDLAAIARQPLFIPESSTTSHALELFKAAGTRVGLVLDEHGGIEGMVTTTDILHEIMGEVDKIEPEYVQREDGSWLLDGLLPIYKLTEIFPELDTERAEDDKRLYSTLAGLLLAEFGHVPKASERISYAGVQFEIMDMDGVRIDKVLAMAVPADEPE